MSETASHVFAAALPAALNQRYEIRGELTQTPSSRSFLCLDNFTQHEVALKIALPGVFDGDAAARKAWLNEIRIVGNLRHPYIAAIHDAGFADGQPYVAGEHFAAGSLATCVRPGRLKTVGEVLEIIHKCASALDYARQAGVIHRRLRPENIFYVGHGEAKVGNFGAVYWEGKAAPPNPLDALRYRAPEAPNGQGSLAADIYALGVVLHQLLTGACPFEADDIDLLRQRIAKGERKPLAHWRNDLPEGLDALLDGMLAVDPAARFANWAAVLAAVSELAGRLGPAADNPEQPTQAELYERLRALPLLKPLDDAQLWELLRLSRWRNVPAGTTFMREGGEALSCYLLLNGEAKVLREHKLIAMFDPGTLFGEMAFAEEPPELRAATVTSTTPATIGKWAYAKLLKASPGLQSKMLEIFWRLAVARLKKSDERYLRLYNQTNATPA